MSWPAGSDAIHDPVHDLSGVLPFIRLPFVTGEGAELPTYFLLISLAFCLCTLWLVRRAERAGLERNRALDLALILMLGGMLGARLYHVLLEEPRYYLENPSRVFEIWRGGFVWFGGALAATAAGLLYLRRARAPYGRWLDLFAPVCAFGYALGRVACLLTGCCYGAICVLPGGYNLRYPTQAFAVLWEFALLAGLLWLEHRRTLPQAWTWLQRPGQIFLVWLAFHSVGRILMEVMRADPRGVEILGMSQATWISLGCLVYFAYHSILRSRR